METLKIEMHRHKNRGKVIQDYIFISLMLFLPILNWALFWLTVNISSIGLAFRDMRTNDLTLRNFHDFWESLTTEDGTLGLAMLNTFKYFFTGILINMPASLFIAFFIYKKIFMYRTFRIIFYLPAIISGVAITRVYTEFISPGGPLAQLFNLKIPPEGLLARDATATPAILMYVIWTGLTSDMLLFGGAMTRIPTEILEAAKLDGIKPFRECISIIFPLIWPTYSTLLILNSCGLFTASGPILLFCPSGEYNTMTLSYWIFKQVYGDGMVGGTGSYNLVSATGLSFTLIGMPVILFIHWLVERIPAVEY